MQHHMQHLQALGRRCSTTSSSSTNGGGLLTARPHVALPSAAHRRRALSARQTVAAAKAQPLHSGSSSSRPVHPACSAAPTARAGHPQTADVDVVAQHNDSTTDAAVGSSSSSSSRPAPHGQHESATTTAAAAASAQESMRGGEPHSTSNGGSSSSSTANGVHAAAAAGSNKSAKAVLQPVTYCAGHTLPPQANWQAAVAALQVTLQATAAQLSRTLPASTSSGVLRFEVPLSRGGPPGGVLPGSPNQPGFSALQWLQGQEALRKTLHTVYFSGRHSTAPDTPGTAAAEAAAQGWGALAGLGSAWLWQGSAGRGFDAGVLAGMSRFLSENQPRLRVVGGSRFNPKQQPSPEWSVFGSFLFLLPQLEVVEADGLLVMALNVAWDARLPDQVSANAAAAGSGPASLTAAVRQALQVLQCVCPPASACAPSLAPAGGPVQHTPDEPGWEQLLTGAVGVLRASEELQQLQNPAVAGVDTGFARQEFITGGQQGLDDLLRSLLNGPEDPPPLATSTLSEEDAEDDHHHHQQQHHSAPPAPAAAAAAAAAAGARGAASDAAASDPGDSSSSGVSSRGDGSSTMQRVLTAADGEAGLQQLQMQSGHAAAAQQDGSSLDPLQQQQQQADEQPLVKVVLARRTAIPWQQQQQEQPAHPEQQQLQDGWQRRSGAVLLQALQERDPRAYQLLLSTPPGATFLACTPERLYVRSGRLVASEAVAGTRPRGPPGDLEADFYQGLDLLQSPKDHSEFTLVRDWIRQQLAPLCVELKTEVQKSVLKQASVQHLYGRLAGVLRRGVGDAAVLEALHPTPAVCGRPRETALRYLEEVEPFDRGFYAGPFGWVSGQGAEFAVAIRSAMVPTTTDAAAAGVTTDTQQQGQQLQPPLSPAAGEQQQQQTGRLLAYAGVGVVAASEVAAEWQELCLKVRQFEGMLSPLLAPPLPALPNATMAWAALAVEELTRLGVSTFAVAPGSRSSPLALAAASHPRTQLTVAIDERSLGFWALGYGRANATGRPAAVICSSGTAVANLLPSVVEASQSHIPLLLLTADRPYELRDTGANQTIDQVKIFGGYTRWSTDVCPPSEALPGRVIVSTVDTAVRMCTAPPAPGPVHLNFQFREPLAPVKAPWSPSHFLRGLEAWQQSAEPYTTSTAALNPAPSAQPLLLGLPSPVPQQQQQQWEVQQTAAAAAAGSVVAGPEESRWLQLLLQAQRGLIVVGEQLDSGAAAAAVQLAGLLGWPVAADVLSGLRVGGSSSSSSSSSDGGSGSNGAGGVMLQHMDHILLPPPAAATTAGGSSNSSSSSSSGPSTQAEWWCELQPDVVLQVGPRVTSKRLNQFMEWSALAPAVDSSRPSTPWLFVSPAPQRHDAAHLLTAHLSMTPQQLLQTVAAATRTTTLQPQQQQRQQQQQQRQPSAYAQLLRQLDAAAAAQIDVTLSQLGQMSEMSVARALAVQFPAGCGLFLGNSMPIRDMDMYAGTRQAAAPLAAVDVPVVTLTSSAAAAAAAGGGGSASNAAGSTTDSSSSSSSSGSPSPLSPSPVAGGSQGLTAGSVDDDSSSALNPSSTLSPSSSSGDTIGSMPPGGLMLWRGSSSSSGGGESSSFSSSSSSSPPAGGVTAASSVSSVSSSSSSSAIPEAFVGVPVAANRGASGIDGVLSSAAGFAAGLQRPVTLVIGDLSFLHDVNGLSLLRGGEMAPPLTVVLINNKGGGIFSFLPVADAVGRAAFERLWGTPQNVDLEGLCRAHGIPHQAVTTPQELPSALSTAWGINRHSVVEVITDRADNLRLHRQLQADVAAAVHAAYRSLTATHASAAAASSAALTTAATPQQQQVFSSSSSSSVAAAQLLPAIRLQPELHIAAVGAQRYSVPLTKPLTSTDKQQQGFAGVGSSRQGLLLTVTLTSQQQQHQQQDDHQQQQVYAGIGEAAPLPGLHTETLSQVSAQLQMLTQLLQGLPVPRTLGLLSSNSLSRWFKEVAGLNPEALYPSVRFALESALLQGLAEAQGVSLAQLLSPFELAGSSGSSSSGGVAGSSSGSNGGSNSGGGSGRGDTPSAVCVNGLLPGSGSVQEVVAAGRALVQAGCRVIKVKVGRRSDPADDAAVILALHRALNSSSSSSDSSSSSRVILTADANRAWTLQQALSFAAALQAGMTVTSDSSSSRSGDSNSGSRGSIDSSSIGSSSDRSDISSVLAYIEEPTQDPADMPTFYAETGIAVAVDESLDQGIVGPQHVLLNPGVDGDSSSSRRGQQLLSEELSSSSGLAAVVIKPAVVGGFERAWGLVRWAQQQGLRAVISSSFESSVGLSALVQLAAAADAEAAAAANSSSSSGDGTPDVMPSGLWAGFGGSGLPTSSTTAAAAAAAAAATHSTAAAADDGADALDAHSNNGHPQQQWHGLGTLSWFAGDTVPDAASLRQVQQQHGGQVPAAAAWKLLQHAASTSSAAAAAGVAAAAAAPLAAGSSTHGSSGSNSSSVQAVHFAAHAVQYDLLSAAGTPMHVTGVLVLPDTNTTTNTTTSSSSSSSDGGGGIGWVGGGGGAAPLPVVLLHGFMGSASDWQPLMAALTAAGHPCLAVNLPGHGGTRPSAAAATDKKKEQEEADCYSLETAAAVAEQAAAAAFGAGQPCLLVGYSMGARMALQVVLGRDKHTPPSNGQHSSATSSGRVCWAGAVIVSGTPGIPDPDLRAARVQKDAELAAMLLSLRAGPFLHWWYQQPLWASLRAHPGFSRLLLKRAAEQEGQERELAAALTYSSTGRMEPLWGELRSCRTPLLLVAGQLDGKFAGIKRRMMARLRQGLGSSGSSSSSGGGGAEGEDSQQVLHQWAEVPGVGHAVHVEAPLQLLQLIRGFSSALDEQRVGR